MTTIDEIVKALAEHPDTAADPAKVAAALQASVQPVWQAAYNRGHSDATKRAEEKAATLAADLEAAKATAEEARGKIAELESKTPDAEKIRSEYKEQIAKLTREREEAEATLKQKLGDERRRRATGDLSTALRKAGVDPLWADDFARREELARRIRHTDDGNIEVLQEGSTEVTLQAPDGTSPLAVLASEYAKKLEPRFLASNGDSGSGLTPGQPGGGAGGYDPVDAGKKMAAAAKTGDADNSLAFR
jgi:hypothetical protein